MGGAIALLYPPIVIDDSSWKNAAESFTVALTLTVGGYESAIVPNGVPMDYAQSKNQFFFSEITKRDPKLSKAFYFNTIPYVLAGLWMFF